MLRSSGKVFASRQRGLLKTPGAKKLGVQLLRALAMAPVTALFLELFLHIAHWGHAPLVPIVVGEGGVPSLPAGMNQTVSFSWGTPTRYVADMWGARISRPEIAADRPAGGVLVVGDSQALGYQISFDQTFAAQVAK